MQSGAIKLSQDLATLVNNRFGSDIQFKVGGNTSTFQENDMNTYNESATTTLYAHSLILRCRSQYFANMLDEDKHWKESSNGIIFKPNISPSIFQDVLYYIYTGNTSAKSFEDIMELIKAADEMNLEELSVQCQTKLEHIVNYFFSKIDESSSEHENKEPFKESINTNIPIDVAVRTLIIPILNLAETYSLSEFTQNLFKIILPHMSVIIESPNAYTAFINDISFESINGIIKSDFLAIKERSIWDLALSWGCHQIKLSKVAVEAQLNNPEDEDKDEDGDDGTIISATQLDQLKAKMIPLLPSVRFSLLDSDDYHEIIGIVSYFLPRTRLSDTPRNEQKIIVESTAWEFLRKSIFETGGLKDCLSLNHLKFKLLFRASEHGFLAATFHQRCDNKGPTFVLVKSVNRHLFGGVNFDRWNSDYNIILSPLNFLFTLPDGRHRKNSEIFKIQNQAYYSYKYNDPSRGPTFGKDDLCIENNANTNQDSYSNMPSSYTGSGASNTTLAGEKYFMVSDYEVFAISKK